MTGTAARGRLLDYASDRGERLQPRQPDLCPAAVAYCAKGGR